MSDSEQADETLAALLLRWEEAWDQGIEISAETLCVANSELVEKLRKQIAALTQMEWMTKPGCEPQNNVDLPHQMLGRTLNGRYRIETLIAEGGFGLVYRAFDPELQRHVALKLAKPYRIATSDQSDQLVEEARRAAKLSHPGIVSVHDVGRDDGMVFIVADLIDGRSLAEVIDGIRPSPLESARIVAEVAEALQFAHDQGFVHRDIKPSNILIDERGRSHVTDFGISATFEQILLGYAANVGTLAYMAPEQLTGETHLIGPSTDIYALGVVLYEMLAGKRPFIAQGPTSLREQIVLRQPQPMTSVDGTISYDLQRICFRCLSKHPSDRFNSLSELATALRNAKARPQASSRMWWLVLPVIISLVVAMAWFGKEWFSGQPILTESRGHAVLVSQTNDGTIFFDGQSRIITPVLSFAPCTLEAWIKTTDDKREQFVIGSDVPDNYGIGIGLKDNFPRAETIRGGFHVEKPIKSVEWTHLAAVFGVTETKLFMNGKKIGVGPPTEKPSHDTQFVIGNVGKDHHNLFLHGYIRSVRISRGERYQGDFKPESNFIPDESKSDVQAVLIFDGSKVEDDRVIDLSGNGNDGRLVVD